MFDEPSAKDRAESGGNRGKPGPRANGLAAGFFVERCADDREAARNQQRRSDTLHTTRDDECFDAGRETASGRSPREDRHAQQEHAASANEIAKRTTCENQSG